MGFLAPLAALLGIEVDSLVERLKRSATTIAIVAALGLIGLVFLLVCANAALTIWVGPVYAPLILGVVALLIAAIVWMVAQGAEKRRQREAAERKREADTTTLMTTAALTALPLALKNPALRLAAIPAGALIGYFLLGRKRGKNGKSK